MDEWDQGDQVKHLTLKQSNTHVSLSADFSISPRMGSSPCLSMKRLQADQVLRQFTYCSLVRVRTRSVCARSTLSKTASKGYLAWSEQWRWSSYMSKVKQGSILLQNSQKTLFSREFSLRTSRSTYPKAMNIPPSLSIFLIFRSIASPAKKCSACPTVIRSNFSSSLKSITWLFESTIECAGWLSLNFWTFADATDSICSLRSMPLTSSKFSQKLSRILPVPTAMSKYLFLLERWSMAWRQSSQGQSGRYFSQLKP